MERLDRNKRIISLLLQPSNIPCIVLELTGAFVMCEKSSVVLDKSWSLSRR